MNLRAKILTISDSVHQGTRQDKSGPTIADHLRTKGFTVSEPEVLPDERPQITTWLRSVIKSQQADIIFTTGGTGVSARDITPEAVREVIDREIPGFGELMRQSGRAFTPLASLSRSLAGSAGTVLIVALPGSPKGALQSLNAILELVPHVHDLLNGRTAHK
jgi:molybdopterin adenylyltransferase